MADNLVQQYKIVKNTQNNKKEDTYEKENFKRYFVCDDGGIIVGWMRRLF